MINKKLSALMTVMGDLLELDQSNPFRIRAFRRAAETIEAHPEDFATLSEKDQLKIPGIGKGIAGMIEEYKQKGRVGDLEKLKKRFPDGVLEIMNLPGLGAKRAALLFKKLKIDSVDKLKKSAQSGKLKALDGFGDKLQESIIKNIAFAKEASKRLILFDAHKIADEIRSHLLKAPYIKDLTLAGSSRRWRETAGDLDFLCTSQNPAKAMDHFLKLPNIQRVLAKGKTKSSVVTESGFQCDFRVVEASSFGAALLYFTGSKQHNVRLREIAQKKGLTLNEYGLYKVSDTKKARPVAGKTEKEVYQKLGMAWIPPELREDRGEVEAALKNKLPNLVTLDDVKGDFHNHTTLSDGSNTIEEMVEAAKKKNWSYYFVADHSPSLTIANGLSEQRLKSKINKIRALNKKIKGMELFCSTEVDIMGDGSIDYSDGVLKSLDSVVASVHSRFKMNEEQMTSRICKAISNPHVDILGHISGRLLNRRESYPLNYDQILETARKTETAIEINGQPDRSELQDIHVKKAIEMGIQLVLSTDAHSVDQLNHMQYAVHIARRGWAEPKHILNCQPLKKVNQWLKN